MQNSVGCGSPLIAKDVSNERDEPLASDLILDHYMYIAATGMRKFL